MKKIMSILKSANLFGVVAIVFVALMMVAFKPAELRQDEVMWGRQQNGTWIQIDPADYSCNPSSGVCKAVYEEGQTPVTGTSADEGFVRVEQNNGYVILNP